MLAFPFVIAFPLLMESFYLAVDLPRLGKP
jgi:hypothetical protein